MAQIIGARTLQVGGAAAVALFALRRTMAPEDFRRLRQLSGPLITGGLSAYFLATFYPRTRFPGGRLITRLPGGSVGRASVALTFDDGPHPETTPRLLDALSANTAEAGGIAADVPATFFLVAEAAQKYPSLVRRIADAGHAIGLHGLSHRTVALDSARRIERDLAEAERRVEDALGSGLPLRLFRPPYGFKSWTLAVVTARLGWTTVGWSCDSRDYTGISAEEIARGVRLRLRAADILLLHERPGAPQTIEALPEIKSVCAERGLRCVALGI